MAEVLDLSTLKKPSNTPDYDALPPEQQEAVNKLAEETEEPAEDVRTAFLVVIDNDGDIQVRPDLDVRLVRAHMPSHNEIYTAAAIIQKDLVASETAMHTATMMQQMAMHAQQQMQAQQIAGRLNLK